MNMNEISPYKVVKHYFIIGIPGSFVVYVTYRRRLCLEVKAATISYVLRAQR